MVRVVKDILRSLKRIDKSTQKAYNGIFQIA